MDFYAEQDDMYADDLETQFGGFDGFADGPEDNMSDAEADADTLASAGWGTDEDYGCYGDEGDF